MKLIRNARSALSRFFAEEPQKPEMNIISVARGDHISAQYDVQPYNPDALIVKKGYDTLDDMRADDQINAVMNMKKKARLSTGWEIHPASTSKADTDAAEFCKWNLERLAGTFNTNLLQILSGLDYGFSATEIIWKLNKEPGDYNGKIILDALKTRKPHHITFYQDEHGNLLEDGVAQETASGEIIRMRKDKFIIYTYQEEFDNIYGRSDYRSFYREWWIKSVILKFYAMWLERFPFPPTIGWYPPGTPDDDVDDLMDILEHLQTGTTATLPMGFTLDQLDVPSTASAAYERAIAIMNKGITRGALVPDLLGFTDSSSRGSYALGKSHFDVFLWVLRDLGFSLGTILTEQLLTPLVQYNFNADVPQFVMPSPEEDLESRSQILKVLLDGQVVDPNEEWVRDYMNVPQADQDYVGTYGERRNIYSISDALKDKVNNLQTQVRLAEVREGTAPDLTRELTQYEKAANVQFDDIDYAFEKWERDLSGIVADILHKEIGGLLPDISDYYQEKSYRKINSLKIPIKDIRDEMVSAMAEAYLTSMAMGVQEIESSLDRQLTFTDGEKIETFAITTAEDRPKPTEMLERFRERIPMTKTEWQALLVKFRSQSFTVAGQLERKIIAEIQRIIYRAIDEDWFVADLQKNIEAAGIKYTGRAWNYPPETPMQKHHTNLVFRNAISNVYNGARRDLYFDPEIDEYVPALQYSAILDSSVRESHRAMDGRIYDKSDKIWQEWFPPNGHNCRCLVVPVTANMDYTVSDPTDLTADAGFGRV